MEEDKERKGAYKTYRMVPPGSLSYFFSNDQKNTFTEFFKPTIVNEE
jgi:hypothetical protein